MRSYFPSVLLVGCEYPRVVPREVVVESAPVTKFLLIRHGDTDAVNHYIAGTAPGTLLNERGREQVRRLADTVRPVTLAAIVSSPLERCRVTADAIAEGRSVPVTMEPALIEFDFGDWTGKTFAELDPDPVWRRFNEVRSLARA